MCVLVGCVSVCVVCVCVCVGCVCVCVRVRTAHSAKPLSRKSTPGCVQTLCPTFSEASATLQLLAVEPFGLLIKSLALSLVLWGGEGSRN